jgi:phosphoglycolate phosphatase
MIKNVIFDFNGTIADTKSFVIDIFNTLADKYHFKQMKPEDIEYLSTLSIMERIRLLRVPIYRIPKFRKEYKEIYRSNMGQLKTIIGIPELLEQLKHEGYKLAILSSHSAVNIKRFLANNNLDLFDCIYSSKDWFGKHRTFRKFLREQGLDSSDVIYLGDEYRDMLACRKADVPGCAVAWGYDSIDLMLKADPVYVANSPQDVVEIIRSMNK